MSALEVKVSAGSSARDFDFIVGNWSIHNRKLKLRLCGCTEWREFDFESKTRMVLSGFGNLDESGNTLRLFDPDTRLWSILGAFPGMTSIDVLKGSFDGLIGTFIGRDIHDGQPVLCQFQWDKSDENAPIWRQALSTDQGETWEWNWEMRFTRIS
ncbi:MAG TPA: hypothetical protein VGL56_17540 [Fimbriimonadaceae bacterium]|jgi:hypothetical protein